MESEPYDQLSASLLLSLFAVDWSDLTLLDWRELVIFTVKIGVVVTVGLIGWLYHWRKVDGGDSPDSEAVVSLHDGDGSFSYDSPKSFCGICFEEVETRKMYKNRICLHSFCCDCTTKHIEAKIQVNSENIFCPEMNCKTPLDPNSCREILSNSILDKWDEFLCLSLIPVSHRIYCPFRDCLSMLVNDSGGSLIQVQCPACWRLFCATCSAPWHPEFSCEDFQRLDRKRENRGEEFVNELAKRNHWRRCPKCKIFVEKTEGCLHITCRCKFEFCYSCGRKWSKHEVACLSVP